MSDPHTPCAADDVQASMHYAAALVKQAMHRFALSRTKLLARELSAEVQRNIELYTESLLDCVVGNVEWSLVNQRYAVYDSPESRSTGIIKFTVDA